jgi:hypothetical protein
MTQENSDPFDALREEIDSIDADIRADAELARKELIEYYNMLPEINIDSDELYCVEVDTDNQYLLWPYGKTPFGPLFEVIINDDGEDISSMFVVAGTLVSKTSLDNFSISDMGEIARKMTIVAGNPKFDTNMRVCLSPDEEELSTTPVCVTRNVCLEGYLVLMPASLLGSTQTEEAIPLENLGHSKPIACYKMNIVNNNGKTVTIVIENNVVFSEKRIKGFRSYDLHGQMSSS